MNTENTLLSVSEAKKQLGVSSQSIRRFISEGQLIEKKQILDVGGLIKY